MITRRVAIGLALALLARAEDPPPAIVDLFRNAAEELASPDAAAFFDHFDAAMPGFAELRNDVTALLTIGYITSNIEFVTVNGNDLEIDWAWRQKGGPLHRAIVKCTVERKGKSWKITKFAPTNFFKPDPL